ncbi:tRNA dihydrouridine(20/20a) synthase DusA [Spirochaeta lutea]|uniref:tRNA dihydrouridine(20/20a) synthase DusA n=1 Tax=Spirochaeta lutea TaxID=1480694 RepID=UPI0007A75B5A|nr:tRNA dihydrouridine(20/20a) synthase DusA [Spirochaeta lutea]
MMTCSGRPDPDTPRLPMASGIQAYSHSSAADGDSRAVKADPAIIQGRPLRPILPAPVSVAPMIDKTHRHFRRFLRLLTRRTLLYTEMITAAAIIHGDRHRLLDFDPVERPLALQLGGGNPEEMAEAVRIAQDWDYDEINLNVGCPSDRVQNGDFGACLMAEGDLVARLVSAMVSNTNKPVTVKHRIGIRSYTRHIEMERYDQMVDFIRTVSRAGAERYTVHARIAILEGLSPKENRDIPPLRYPDVYRLKQEHPELFVEINGGIKSHHAIAEHLRHVDAVMVGRASYDDPYLFSEMDRRYFGVQDRTWPDGGAVIPSRREVIQGFFQYLRVQAEEGLNPRNLVWPILELFSGKPGTRRWKQRLSRPIPRGWSLDDYLSDAFDAAPEDWLDVRGLEDRGDLA